MDLLNVQNPIENQTCPELPQLDYKTNSIPITMARSSPIPTRCSLSLDSQPLSVPQSFLPIFQSRPQYSLAMLRDGDPATNVDMVPERGPISTKRQKEYYYLNLQTLPATSEVTSQYSNSLIMSESDIPSNARHSISSCSLPPISEVRESVSQERRKEQRGGQKTIEHFSRPKFIFYTI